MSLTFWSYVFWYVCLPLLLHKLTQSHESVTAFSSSPFSSTSSPCPVPFSSLFPNPSPFPFFLLLSLLLLLFVLASHLYFASLLFLLFSLVFAKHAHIWKGRTLQVINDKIYLDLSWLFFCWWCCFQFTNSLIQPFLLIAIKADDTIYDTIPELFCVHCRVFLLPHYQLLGCRRAVNIIVERLPLPNDTGN